MKQAKLGLSLGVLAYILWGLLSLYWKLLSEIDPYTVFSYRILMTVVTMLGYLVLSGKQRESLSELKNLWKSRRSFWTMVAAGLIIAINWLTYIVAISINQAAEASLGYYLMPLVSLVLSVLFLREKIELSSMLALGIAALGVLVLLVQTGRLPLVSLLLAISFGVYGLLKKRVPLSSPLAMLFEATTILIVAVPYLLVKGQSLETLSYVQISLLVLSGVVTAIPLLLFAEAVKRAPLNRIGFVQYINPTIQLFIAVIVYGETVSAAQWIGFACIWIAIVVFLVGQWFLIKSSE